MRRLGFCTGLLAAALAAGQVGCLLDSGAYEDAKGSSGAGAPGGGGAGGSTTTPGHSGGAGGSGGQTTTTPSGGAGGQTTSSTTDTTSSTTSTTSTTTTTTTTTTTMKPVCGDGNVDMGEECDDANDTEGDGCFKCKKDCGCPGCQVGQLCNNCGPDPNAVEYKDPTTKHCYAYVPAAKNWNDARTACKSDAFKGDLAGLSTQTEMSMILGTKIIGVFQVPDPSNARCWTGGNEIGSQGTYKWANGEMWQAPPAGPSWGAGEPNDATDDCFVIGSDGTLRDRNCANDSFQFLCERH